MPKALPKQAILSLFPLLERRTIKWEKKLMVSQMKAGEWKSLCSCIQFQSGWEGLQNFRGRLYSSTWLGGIETTKNRGPCVVYNLRLTRAWFRRTQSWRWNPEWTHSGIDPHLGIVFCPRRLHKANQALIAPYSSPAHNWISLWGAGPRPHAPAPPLHESWYQATVRSLSGNLADVMGLRNLPSHGRCGHRQGESSLPGLRGGKVWLCALSSCNSGMEALPAVRRVRLRAAGPYMYF